MDRISDTRKCMASLAIFKTLYDEKKDLYSVIASFSGLLHNSVDKNVKLYLY